MEISKNNWFVLYYNWMYKKRPNDICSLFWGSVFAIGLFFLLIPGRLVQPKAGTGSQVGAGILIWMVYAALILAGVGLIDGFGYEYTNMIWLLISASIATVRVVGIPLGIIIALVIGAITTHEHVTSTQVYEGFKDRTSDFVGAVRQKHCTKIIYK